MRVENAFEVQQPPVVVWDRLMDVPRVVPCLPGAKLVETLGEDRWKAELSVKLGPVSMTFDADVTRAESDSSAGRVRLMFKAREQHGRGGATGEIHSLLVATGDATRVTVTTDVRLQGPVARIGRSEIVEEVSQEMVDAFASCLKASLVTGSDPAPAAPPAAGRMLLRALWARLRRLFARSRG